MINKTMERKQKVDHQNTSFLFSIPNALNKYRVDTFSTKEPETLEWIDGIPKGSVVWDIGANVGLYSCYAAKSRGCNVYAFEPSVFNLELLARNIFLNELSDKIIIIPLPLSDTLKINAFKMTTTEWGGALSTFGQDYGFDGKPMNKIFEYSTIGLSMERAINTLKIPQPDFIKMDVDGIEHLIIKGGMTVLEKVKSILIEINDDFSNQANSANMYLQQAGFTLREKRHADFLDVGMSKNTYNQIWTR